MKKIFITVSRGFLARNILQTDIFKNLISAGPELIISSPGFDDPEFVQTFSSDTVRIVPFYVPKWTWLDRRLAGLHHNLLWSGTVRFTAKYGIYKAHKLQSLRYVFQLIVFKPLSYLKFLRRFARWLDVKLRPPDQVVLDQLKKEQPDLVFLTNPMEDADNMYIKAAKRLNIPTVGLVKSWDNMSKTSFRTLTDQILVWGDYMKDEAVDYQQYPAERIWETGVPQFDIYFTRQNLRTREETLRSFGLDPTRKTIIFGSEGKVTPHDPEIVAGLAKMIEEQSLIERCQVLVRPHFGYKNDAEKFDAVASLPHVTVDRKNKPRPVFYDQWDYSREHFYRLAETLQAGDVMVTTASTLAIDAAMLDMPAIAIAFDGQNKYPHQQSVARWYETEYYQHVLHTGAVLLVKNFAELRLALNAVWQNPGLRQQERQALVRRFAGRYDGHSGERIANFLVSMAQNGQPPAKF